MFRAWNSVSLLARFGTKPIAPIDGAKHIGAAIGRRHHNDRQRRIGRAQLDQKLEAVLVGELQVEQHQIELRVGRQCLARCLGRRNADHADVRAEAQDDSLQCRQDQRMVIDQQDLHGVAFLQD